MNKEQIKNRLADIDGQIKALDLEARDLDKQMAIIREKEAVNCKTTGKDTRYCSHCINYDVNLERQNNIPDARNVFNFTDNVGVGDIIHIKGEYVKITRETNKRWYFIGIINKETIQDVDLRCFFSVYDTVNIKPLGREKYCAKGVEHNKLTVETNEFKESW